MFRFVILIIHQLLYERNNEPHKIDLLNVDDSATFLFRITSLSGISVQINICY
jgi:hypothetical protein